MKATSDFDSRAWVKLLGGDEMGMKESMWACFPAGPLERQFEEGIQGGIERRGP
jgi:hypothetical protein